MAMCIHDNLLIPCEVDCEARTIILHTEYRLEDEPREFTDVVFKGVEGYRFQNRARGCKSLNGSEAPSGIRRPSVYFSCIARFVRLAP